MIKLMIFQGRPLVLIIDLHAHFHSDSALYPDSGYQSDSGLSQGGILTVVFIPTVVYILTVVSSLSDYSHQCLSCCTSKILCICPVMEWMNRQERLRRFFAFFLISAGKEVGRSLPNRVGCTRLLGAADISGA